MEAPLWQEAKWDNSQAGFEAPVRTPKNLVVRTTQYAKLPAGGVAIKLPDGDARTAAVEVCREQLVLHDVGWRRQVQIEKLRRRNHMLRIRWPSKCSVGERSRVWGVLVSSARSTAEPSNEVSNHFVLRLPSIAAVASSKMLAAWPPGFWASTIETFLPSAPKSFTYRKRGSSITL